MRLQIPLPSHPLPAIRVPWTAKPANVASTASPAMSAATSGSTWPVVPSIAAIRPSALSMSVFVACCRVEMEVSGSMISAICRTAGPFAETRIAGLSLLRMAAAARMEAGEGFLCIVASFVNGYETLFLRVPCRVRSVVTIVVFHPHLISCRDAGHVLNEAAFDVDGN